MNMNKQVRTTAKAVIATLCKNQRGITAKLAEFLLNENANILGLYSTRLGSHYMEGAHFEGTEDSLARIELKYANELQGFEPVMQRTESVPLQVNGDIYELSLYAYDKRGIVRWTANLVASAEVDIVGMCSSVYSAPMTGEPLFVVEMKLDVTSDVSAEKLRSELNALAGEHGWDVQLRKLSGESSPRISEAAYPPSRAQTEHTVNTKRHCA
jgi:glycine cleavage system regulatory protein